LVGSSNLTLSGGGTVSMGNSANNLIFGSPGAGTLTNMNNIIQGAGNIGNNSLVFINDGTVMANQTTPLIIQASGTGFTNNGIVQANNGSTLEITGPFTNFNNTTLTGGTYNVAGGTLEFTNANIVTNAADHHPVRV
jgi:hypothetical protein